MLTDLAKNHSACLQQKQDNIKLREYGEAKEIEVKDLENEVDGLKSEIDKRDAEITDLSSEIGYLESQI